jgi:autotransporter passenger strand-loop-strand repeat protein
MGTTVGNGGFLAITGYSYGDTVLKGGFMEVLPYAGAYNTTLDGGWEVIFAGGLGQENTLNAGAQFVYGEAVDTSIAGGMQGATQHVYGGGEAWNTNIFIYGTQVTEGGWTHDTVVYGGAMEYLHGGGAHHSIVLQGGLLVVESGVAIIAHVEKGGTEIVMDSDLQATIDGGLQELQKGGQATNVLVENHGLQKIDAGCSAHHTTIGAYGQVEVQQFGMADSINFNGAHGSVTYHDLLDADGQQFTGFDVSDQFIFRNTGPGATWSFTENAQHTEGVLTIKGSSGSAALTLLGNHSAAEFAMSYGPDGTTITDVGLIAHSPSPIAGGVIAWPIWM